MISAALDVELPPWVCAPSAGDPLALPVLVINRVFQPIRITSARRAVRLLYTGTAHALTEDGELLDFRAWLSLPVREGRDDALPIVNGALRVPRIVHLVRYARMRRPTIRLTRRNLMLRDGYTCQYCLRRRPVRELDIDHVLPRSRGGEDSWTNLVTACQPCNRRKGRRTPSEANMPLRRRPVAPRWSTAAQLLAGTARRYREWEPFLEAC
ncbi:MAG TPA: HNH endonuclease [Polyangiaceae bacterium]|nr:HNH endonuclease [Polyangiaceae bacterium]